MRTPTAAVLLLLTACACAAEPGAPSDAASAEAAETNSASPAAAEPIATKSRVPKPAPHDEELVWAGLEALNRGEGTAAVAALEEALSGGSKCYLVDWNARAALPLAYVASGDLEAAARRAEELAHGAPADVALGLRQVRADIECARGSVDDAVVLYRDILRSVSGRSTWNEGLNYTVFLEVGAKLRLLAKTLPALDPAWIVGAERFDFTGRVAVLSYLSPFVPPCAQTATLERLRALPQAPMVAAVVAIDADQHVPGPYEIPQEMWPKPTQSTKERSAAWRAETGAGFPVLGVAPNRVPEDATLFRYDAVVDRERRVVFVSSQSDPGGVIEEAVLRRLVRR